MKGDSIPLLKSHGQALKQECCLSRVFIDDLDASSQPISCTNWTAIAFHIPAVSMAMGYTMCVCVCVCVCVCAGKAGIIFRHFCCVAQSAAAAGIIRLLAINSSASVFGVVMFHATDLSLAQEERTVSSR